MNHDMTVHAGATSSARARINHRACCSRKSTLDACDSAGKRCLTVVRAVMALVTQERGTRFKQWRDIGTMRRMAIGAVFRYGLMLPKEGAAFLSMAGEAGFRDRILFEQFWTGRTMWIVAIRTDDLASIDRVSRDLVALCSLFLVTGKADFGLSLLVAHLVMRCVDFVARNTCQVTYLVDAALPVSTI